MAGYLIIIFLVSKMVITFFRVLIYVVDLRITLDHLQKYVMNMSITNHMNVFCLKMGKER